jgi:hypothetical protein
MGLSLPQGEVQILLRSHRVSQSRSKAGVPALGFPNSNHPGHFLTCWKLANILPAARQRREDWGLLFFMD